ncbi:hypothetical protein EAG_11884 [Camponotus floridanus]|uniref:Uncharacterized protein n=1 Tax=Camponotus floridanus TaxID=104421 RepID=E1ZY05_CAMFO|nr:hypothetical protein EAG_11884 [Camponotus floridanus]
MSRQEDKLHGRCPVSGRDELGLDTGYGGLRATRLFGLGFYSSGFYTGRFLSTSLNRSNSVWLPFSAREKCETSETPTGRQKVSQERNRLLEQEADLPAIVALLVINPETTTAFCETSSLSLPTGVTSLIYIEKFHNSPGIGRGSKSLRKVILDPSRHLSL